MTKMVNGIVVEMSAAEERALREEWDQNERKRREEKDPATLLEEVNALNPNDLNKLLRALVVEKLRSQPDWARAQGVNLDGDRPVNRAQKLL